MFNPVDYGDIVYAKTVSKKKPGMSATFKTSKGYSLITIMIGVHKEGMRIPDASDCRKLLGKLGWVCLTDVEDFMGEERTQALAYFIRARMGKGKKDDEAKEKQLTKKIESTNQLGKSRRAAAGAVPVHGRQKPKARTGKSVDAKKDRRRESTSDRTGRESSS